MLVNKIYREGKEEVEIVRGNLSTGSYFRFSLVLTIAFTLLYLFVSALGYGYEILFGDHKSVIGFSAFWWILAIQFFGLLFGLFLSYPFYRLITLKFFSQIFKFSGKREDDL